MAAMFSPSRFRPGGRSDSRSDVQADARPRHFALVPAAGSGARLGSPTPKQYLPLAGRPMIWHALSVLCRQTRIAQVYVVLSAGDAWWAGYDWSSLGDTLRPVFCGGATRAESVVNGLAAMAGELAEDDWVLVHDAARPCLSPILLDALLNALADDPVGGLLALPVADTLKRAHAEEESSAGMADLGGQPDWAAPRRRNMPHGAQAPRVAATVTRDELWQAQTPQMFRYGLLRAALAAAPKEVTDEAGALEMAGYRPRLVPSELRNFKVTYPADLALAELILAGSR